MAALSDLVLWELEQQEKEAEKPDQYLPEANKMKAGDLDSPQSVQYWHLRSRDRAVRKLTSIDKMQ